MIRTNRSLDGGGHNIYASSGQQKVVMAHKNKAATARKLIALDIGGTKTHAALYHGATLVAQARSGSSNVQNVSKEEAQSALAEAIQALGNDSVDLVIAGAGGIDTEQDAHALCELIAPLVPGAEVRAVHDTRLILAAGHAQTGISLILGTGSAAWGVNARGDEARSGGWGYLLGDEGAGYWFGREAVRSALHEANLGLRPGKLTTALLEHTGCTVPEQLISQFHQNSERGVWAGCAPLVFDALEAQDPNAEKILAAAVQHAAGLVKDVADQLKISGPVVIGGGVIVNQQIYRDRLAAALAGSGHHDVRFLEDGPVHGAAFIAGLLG